MTHHKIDPRPIPEKGSVYINEPWLIDTSREPQMQKDIEKYRLPEDCEDNIRVFIPMDLNRNAILRRLDYVINKYGEASEENEFAFRQEVGQVISQLEIYDQIRYVRNMPSDGSRHNEDVVSLAGEIIGRLENIEDAGAEMFPFELIDELRAEFT